MSKKFDFPQEVIIGAIKNNYSFKNGIEVNGEDYAVMINNSNNLMVIKNKALKSSTAKRIAEDMFKNAIISQEQMNAELAKFSKYKQFLNNRVQIEDREL